jgi:hypothetical protein
VPRRVALAAALLLTVAPALGACSDGGEAEGGGSGLQPRVDWIDDAMAAVAAARGGEPEYVEVSATLEHVDAIVRDGDATSAVLYRYLDGELSGPVEPRDDPRSTFGADRVTIDPDTIFDGVRAELGDPTIVDLAIRMEGEVQVIDATIAGEQGGVILVLLSPAGDVLGLQAT